jgi:phosphate transport system substrate-binding protein
LALIAAAALSLAGCDGNTAREIRVVGSSTVYPFTTAVAETFVNQGGGRRAPVVESIGTGAGLKRFCEGVGWEFPDIANASRAGSRNPNMRCARRTASARSWKSRSASTASHWPRRTTARSSS